MPTGNVLRAIGLVIAAALASVAYLRFNNGNTIQAVALVIAAGVAVYWTFQRASR